MRVVHALQPQDVAQLAAVHKKLGALLDSINGKTPSASSGEAPKKRGPKPGSKNKKKVAPEGGKKYDPSIPTDIAVTPSEPVPASA